MTSRCNAGCCRYDRPPPWQRRDYRKIGSMELTRLDRRISARVSACRHSAWQWPRQCERELHQARCQSQANDELPGEVIRTQHVEEYSAAERADETAELMAHESDALDHCFPAQPEHFHDRPGDQRTDAQPQKAHDGGK